MSSHHSGPAGKQVPRSRYSASRGRLGSSAFQDAFRGARVVARRFKAETNGAYQAGRRLDRPLRALFDDPCDVLVPPGSAAAGTPSLSVQGSRNPSQRLATLTQATDLAQRGLLARIRLDVLAVRRQPVSELDIPHPFALPLLGAERIAGPFPNGLALPLADRAHDRDDQSDGG